MVSQVLPRNQLMKLNFTLNLPASTLNRLAQEFHKVYIVKVTHGSLKQDHWTSGKADLA